MAHKTPSGKSSDAWKSLERAWAKLLQDSGFKKAKRKSRAGNIGESTDDVSLPEIPNLKSDCKYKNGGHTHHTTFFECEKKYVMDKSDFLVMPTKGGGERGFLVTLRGEVFAKILAKAYLGGKTDSSQLTCPSCSGIINNNTSLAMGLQQHVCPDCKFEFMTKQSENLNVKN